VEEISEGLKLTRPGGLQCTSGKKQGFHDRASPGTPKVGGPGPWRTKM